MELFLIVDPFNKHIFEEQSFTGFKIIDAKDDLYEKIDLWIIIGVPSDHPHLLRMFKNGAHLISPSSSYLMELREDFNEIIGTYAKGDMRSAHDLVLAKSEMGHCASYELSQDLEVVEINRVIEGYLRSIRRRELAKKRM